MTRPYSHQKGKMKGGAVKVLILDDDSGLLNVMKEGIEQWGDICDCVNSYAEAVGKMDRYYDAVISDIVLKGESKTGIDFVKEYSRRHPNSVIILMTGKDWVKIPNYDFIAGKILKTVPLKWDELKYIMHDDTGKYKMQNEVYTEVYTLDHFGKDIEQIRARLMDQEHRITEQEGDIKLIRHKVDEIGKVNSTVLITVDEIKHTNVENGLKEAKDRIRLFWAIVASVSGAVVIITSVLLFLFDKVLSKFSP